jgi:integrase
MMACFSQSSSQKSRGTQSEARAKLDELEARVAEGLPPKAERQSVVQFLETWLDVVCCPPNVSPKTERTYRDLCEDHIIPALGRIELSRLRPQHVQQFINDLMKTPKRPRKKNIEDAVAQGRAQTEPQECFSSRTAKHCRDALRPALNVAMIWNLISRNAAALATVNTNRGPKAHVYDQTQAGAFLEAISGDRLEALFWLALCIGPREGELLGLQWTDIDFEKGRIAAIVAKDQAEGRKTQPSGTDTNQNGSQRS